MTRKVALFIILVFFPFLAYASDEYFYCEIDRLDGSALDYAKWGKGTDFKFNKSKNRWEWVTEYTFQYIYPDGRYEQIARVDYFGSERGQCNKAAEAIYRKKMADLKAKYGS